MLFKLLKYEIRALMKQFAILWPAAIIIAPLTALMYSSAINTFSTSDFGVGIMTFFLYGVLFAIGIISLMFIISRFSSGLLSDEGYLMFTLPTRASTLILSKLIISLFTVIISSVVAAVSMLLFTFILFGTTDVLGTIGDFIVFTVNFAEFSPIHVVEYIFVGLTACASSILLIYLACSIGHLVPQHRRIVTFFAWLIINTVSSQVINAISHTALYDSLENYISGASFGSMMHLLMLLLFVVNVITAVIYFAITNYILTRKLSLE